MAARTYAMGGLVLAGTLALLSLRLSDHPHVGDGSLTGPRHPQVLFYGDSITRGIGRFLPQLFPGRNFAADGMNGITTSILLRNLPAMLDEYQPTAIVLLGGANDIEQADVAFTLQQTEDNLEQMITLAEERHVLVVLCSLTPAHNPESVHFDASARQLNAWLRSYSLQHGLGYIDYYSSMVDASGEPRAGLTEDGEHPSAAGLRLMASLARPAIDEALASAKR